MLLALLLIHSFINIFVPCCWVRCDMCICLQGPLKLSYLLCHSLGCRLCLCFLFLSKLRVMFENSAAVISVSHFWMLVLQVVVDFFLTILTSIYINVFFILTTACHQCANRRFLFHLNVGCFFLLFCLFFDVHEWSCLAKPELSRRACSTYVCMGRGSSGWSLGTFEMVLVGH